MKIIYKTKTPKRYIKKIAVFDVECWKDAVSFAFGVVSWTSDLNTIHEKVFFDKNEMKEFLLSKELSKYHIFAHNGSKYDYITIFNNYIIDNTDILLSSGALIKWENNKRYFYDSYILLRSGVGKIGDALKLKKGETPIKFILGKQEDGINDTDIEYCKRDVRIILQALIEIVKEFKIIKPTIAGLSFKLFTNSLKRNIIVREELDNFFVKTYRGGRTECFYRGKYDKAYYYDVNSMYPYVMSKFYYPNPSKLNKIVFNVRNNFDFLDDYEGCVYIEGYSNDEYIGALPVFKNGKLIFSSGYVKGYYNICEVRTALKTGILSLEFVGDGIVSDRYVPDFRNLILDFYEKRAKYKKEGNEFMALFYKFILNSLYGKFGQKNRSNTYYFSSEDKAFDYLSEKKLNNLGVNKINDYYYVSIHPENEFYKKAIYCWASYTTSLARAVLLDYMVKAGFRNVLYCDTDSLILSKEMDKQYVDDYQLGKLKLEGVGEFIGIKSKLYKFDNKIKAKGGTVQSLDVKDNCFIIDGQLVTISSDGEMLCFKNDREKLITLKESMRVSDYKYKLGVFEMITKYYDVYDNKRDGNEINQFTKAIKFDKACF